VLAADLLADVHRLVLAGPMPRVPARILDWAEGFLPESSAARPALARLQAAASRLTDGIVYGDPGPEILVAEGRPPALIDWGTPTRGPLLYDVAAWALHFSAGDLARLDRFFRHHRKRSVLAPSEYDHFADAVTLARASVP
jgi:Ser/Thr protein kinase RdoA (MazF antagonist)